MLFRFVGRVCLPAVLAVLAFGLAATPVSAAGLVRRAPAPVWVTATPIPQVSAERARQVAEGLYFLLLDHQDRPGLPDLHYLRTAYKVTDRSGLEDGARFDVTFDPASEDVILHHVRVWRAGVAEDRLRDASVQVLRRESELDDGVFTGLKTAHLELKDVRVGDIVDYAYSLENRDTLMAGAFSSDFHTGWQVPVGMTRYRLLWPHGRPITIKTFAGAPQPRLTRGADRDEYLWEVADAPPVREETGVPEWRDQWGRVAISSMVSWDQMANWSLPMYPVDAPLTAAWNTRIDEIARRFPNAHDRLTEALRLVQDDIRYVSLAIGPGSFRPRLPAEVIRSGYGDCKDKTLLLVTVLRRLGISALPALTDMDRGPGLVNAPPGVSAFDHVIVRVEMDGKVWWVDPTASQEGGRFPALAALSYGWALPIRKGQEKLEAIPKPTAPAPTMDVVERYELPRGPDRDLALTVTSTYRGADANRMRSDLASRSAAEIEKKYLDFYTGVYPQIRTGSPLKVVDSRDANVLITYEHYILSAKALANAGLINSFPLRLSGLSDHKEPPPGERRLPLALPYPLNKHHRIVLVTPGRKPPAPADATVDGKAFKFALTSKREGDVLTLDATLVGRTDLIEPADVEAFRSDFNKLGDAAYAELDLASTAGGNLGDNRSFVIAGLAIALLAGSVFGVRAAFKADAAHAGWGVFHPVSVEKFLLMSACSAGLYSALWFWRCWRWAKLQDGQDIQPFSRALFRVVWLYPLFQQANGRLQSRSLPAWIGLAAAVSYFAWAVASVALGRWDAAPLLLRVLALGSFVLALPTLIAVNRLNGSGAAIRANSRFGWRTAAGAAIGIAYTTLIFI